MGRAWDGPFKGSHEVEAAVLQWGPSNTLAAGYDPHNTIAATPAQVQTQHDGAKWGLLALIVCPQNKSNTGQVQSAHARAPRHATTGLQMLSLHK